MKEKIIKHINIERQSSIEEINNTYIWSTVSVMWLEQNKKLVNFFRASGYIAEVPS